jgi:predicted hydrocarbon binding protein
MARFSKLELQLDHKFDSKASRHYLNDQLSVLHCHHYATLYCPLADDVDFVEGKKLLASVAESCFYNVLNDYVTKHEISSTSDIVTIAEEYFAAMGLGKMNVVHVGSESGEVELVHSHVDEGWIKKWGKRDQPVNFIAQGYIAAVAAVINGKSAESYVVSEQESIVSGSERSLFKVVAR